jgi:hypothetical protein
MPVSDLIVNPSAAPAGAVGNARPSVPLPGAAEGRQWGKPLCCMVQGVLALLHVDVGTLRNRNVSMTLKHLVS